MTVKEFMDENRDDLKKAFALVGGVYLCRILGIRVPLSYSSPSRTSNSTKTTVRYIYAPSNYIEEAIKSIAETAVSSTSSFTKEKSCDEIFSIVAKNKDGVSDSTKSYAITAMKNIASRSTSSYTKEHVSELITKLAKGEY